MIAWYSLLTSNNFAVITSLIHSVIQPVNRIREESTVVIIHLKELNDGFRVLSAETALIESLPSSRKQFARNLLFNFNVL
jgi:hypothetical protein